MAKEITVTHQRAFSLPITTASTTTTSTLSTNLLTSSLNSNSNKNIINYKNNFNKSSDQLTDKSLVTIQMPKTILPLLSPAPPPTATDFINNNLTNVNHINCFHQRTRSLPLTEETSAQALAFQSPSASSSSSSLLLHSSGGIGLAATTTATGIVTKNHKNPNVGASQCGLLLNNSTLSSLSSLNSSSNSSITGINGSGISILNKLCENVCTVRNYDGTRQHQAKCCFYQYSSQQKQQQQQQQHNYNRKDNRNISSTYNHCNNNNNNNNSNNHHNHHQNSIINHKQNDNNLFPLQSCNNNNNNNNIETSDSYLMMTSSRKSMTNSMDSIDENQILAIPNSDEHFVYTTQPMATISITLPPTTAMASGSLSSPPLLSKKSISGADNNTIHSLALPSLRCKRNSSCSLRSMYFLVFFHLIDF